MRQAKPGVVFVAAIVALMGIGFGYAHWVKVVTVDGTVTTGTLELEPSFKVTHPWEVPENEETYLDEKNAASMKWWIEDNTLHIIISNVYPCLTIGATFDIKNTGTVPAGLHKWTVTIGETSHTIFDADNIQGSIIKPTMNEDEVEAALKSFVESNAPHAPGAPGAVTVTVDFDGSDFWQIDPGEEPTVDITIHFDEGLLQGKSYSFTMNLEYWNWNEVGYL